MHVGSAAAGLLVSLRSLQPAPAAVAEELSSGGGWGGRTLRVGTGEYGSISEAVASARDGDVVLLEGGGVTYDERIVLDKAVTLRGQGADSTAVSHSTKSPYEATVTLACSGARLESVRVLHASKSVAGNYACYVADGCVNVTIADCVVSSKTGSGIGVEGGVADILGTTVRDCKNNGILLTSDLGETRGGGRVKGCTVSGCGLDGIALRRTFGAVVEDTRVSDARGVGVSVRFCDAATRVDRATVQVADCAGGAFVYEDSAGARSEP